jgi:hypothetical protein
MADRVRDELGGQQRDRVADVLVEAPREQLAARLTGCVRACGEGQEDL